MFGDAKRDTIRYTGGILHTEVVVPIYIRKKNTPLPYIFLEGVGRLHGPVPERRTTPPPPMDGL